MNAGSSHSVIGGVDDVLGVSLFMTAAHELKSPLALIRQLALGIELGIVEPKEIARVANQITLTSERALRLTSDLTKTSRLEDSLFELEPINPVSLCQELASELSPMYRSQGRKLQVKTRSRTMLGLANRELLRRILANFIDNALHYGESDEPVIVSASVVNSGERIRIGVRDFGPSVPSDFWRQMDNKSNIVQSVNHARPQSSGLGVRIAKQFANAMEAKVGTTRHKDGVTFYVEIGTSNQLRLL